MISWSSGQIMIYPMNRGSVPPSLKKLGEKNTRYKIMNNSFADWDEIQKKIDNGTFTEADLTAEDWKSIEKMLFTVSEVIYSANSETIQLILDALPDDIDEADPDEQPLPTASDGKNVQLLMLLGKAQRLFELSPEQQKDKVKARYAKNEGYSIMLDWEAAEEILPQLRYLTPFDRRVHDAVASVWQSGQTVITLQGIHYLTGGKSRAGANEIKRINSSLSKMAVHITIAGTDGLEEETGGKHKSGVVIRKESILSTKAIMKDYAGKRIEGNIQILTEPPLLALGKEWRQVTAIAPEVLQLKGNRSDDAMLIHDYIVSYVARLRHNPKSVTNKLTFAAIYKRLGIKPDDNDQVTRNKRSDTRKRIPKSLERLKDTGYIVSYEIGKDSISFTVPEKPLLKVTRRRKKCGK